MRDFHPPKKSSLGKFITFINITEGAFLLVHHSCEISSVPVMTSIFENANSFLPRSLSEWPM